MLRAREKVLLIYGICIISLCQSVLENILSSVEITIDVVLVTILLGAIAALFYGTVITIIALVLRIITVDALKENT